MNTKIKVLIIETNKEPEERIIKDELRELQGIVGGHIELVGLKDNIDIICNETGLIDNLPLTRVLYLPYFKSPLYLFGPLIICSHNKEGDMLSLSEKQLIKAIEVFKL